MNKKGFTIVELVIVIAVIAILAAVSIVGYTSFTKKAKQSVCSQEAIQLRDLVLAADINDDTFDISDGVKRTTAKAATTYTADEAKTKNRTIEGAKTDGQTITEEQKTTSGISVAAAVDNGLYTLTEEEADNYNATLTGHVSEGDQKDAAIAAYDELTKIKESVYKDAGFASADKVLLSYSTDAPAAGVTVDETVLVFTASNEYKANWNVKTGAITVVEA